MNLNSEQLTELEEFASLLMSPEEIATILEIDRAELKKEIKSESGPVYTAFIKGKLKTEAALRKATIKFAQQGSTPALASSMKFRDELNTILLKR